MKLTGASARIFFVRFLRPMRCCSKANGAGRPAISPVSGSASSFHTRISPSSTVPSGSALASASISGKRSVTSSSPRDQIQTLPCA